jgi:uncharacterized protein YndB with AHSA1/START domain
VNPTTFAIEPNRQEILMTRDFDAPRELVFKAMTDPELVPRWWGPRTHTTRVDAMEARFGGAWRYVVNDADGHETAFRGAYHEMVAPERLVTTFEWEGMRGHVGLVTTTLEDVGGKTRLTELSLFPSVEDRDINISNGMQGGATETMDRLEELLATAEVTGKR